MFSVSNIKEEVSPSVYRHGRVLYEAEFVRDFSYEIYMEKNLPVADISARVYEQPQEFYKVEACVDEGFSCISSCKCNCETFYNYEGICKHCVAVLLAYADRRQVREILEVKGEEGSRQKTASSLKNLLHQYSLRKESVYLIPETIYGKVELEPHFFPAPGGAMVEFRIGIGQKYVLKNISDFLAAVKKNEKVRYGKKLEFYHRPEAFSEAALQIIQFLKQQEEDRRRQSRSHAYYVYTGGYERTMELDEVGIDRFFDAVGTHPFCGEFDWKGEHDWYVAEEEKKPILMLRGENAGVHIQLEDMHVLRGSQYYYFYQENAVYRSSVVLRQKMNDFFDYMERQVGRESYIAEEELPIFCRDLLPLLGEGFELILEDFDESFYVPPKPSFELYLDKQDKNVMGAKLLSVYQDKKYNVLEKIKPGEVRDFSEEIRIRNLVEPYFNGYSLNETIFVLSNDEDMIYRLLSGGLLRLSEYMEIYTSDTFRSMRVIPSPSVAVGISLKSDLLELKIQSEALSSEELSYVLTRYDRKKKYIRLKNGDFLDIQDDGLGVLAEISEDLHLTERDLKSGSVNVAKYRAMYLDMGLRENKVVSVEKNRAFKAIVRNMKTIEDSDYEVPDSLKSIMRSYQKTGFLWLKTLRENGFGGILADDMGLGKTLQVISLLLSEQQMYRSGEREKRRSLIVCPASLVYNWQKEMKRFAPELVTVMVTGLAAERKSLIEESRDGAILITSYDLLKRDTEFYQDIIFGVQVIDEAQYIKNPLTQAAKGVKTITAAFKLALTGTPIENRLAELWSIFDYLMPGFLYTYQRFRKEIEIPIVLNQDGNKMKRLQRMIRPFVLRRLKGDVLTDLPEKLEEAVFARMEGEQRELYDAHVQKMRQILDKKSDKEFQSDKMQILAELTKLRQLCCDPALLLESYRGRSAKTDMCMELILNAVSGGHKILLFSQFTSMLNRLSDRLEEEGIGYYMLTGSVGKEKRMQMVESFGKDDVAVFCISLKAGGTGLNLTAADIVIHYDPWWNVAVQNQATDRAHRIGQKNTVMVYKLYSEGTIEEKIIRIQERKKMLAEQILEGEGMDSATFSREEILELLS